MLIEGTLSGDDAVVVFSEGLEDSVTLTVWKAEVNEEGTVVGTPDYDYMMDVEAEGEEEAKLVYRFGTEGNETFEIPFTDEELDILRAVFG